MKKLLISLLALLSITSYNYAQNDTMYIMKNGMVINKQSVKTTDVDSIVFYKPTIVTPNTITDVDGNVYHTVTIGTQVWMAENLKTTKYSNGDIIGTTVPANLDISSESNPKYEWVYDNNGANIIPYGRLYTWYAITDSRGVCPTGWHVSTDEEWTVLTNFLGGESIAGGKLKETGTAHWNTPNTGSTNEANFTAVPGGSRNVNGSHESKEQSGFWWTATAFNTENAWNRLIVYNTGNISRIDNNKKIGFSVRCVKD